MSEFSLIDKYFRPLARDFAPALDLRDDAAVFSVPPMQQLVVTKDMIASGVHFIGNEDPALIAQKALRVNISDLLAKGAAPYAYSLGIGLPDTIDADAFLSSFCDGLLADQKEFGIRLSGGDTIHTKKDLLISVTAYGTVPQGQMMRRSGARPGDVVFITGTIGDSGLGLRLLQNKLADSRNAESEYLKNRYLLPQPRSRIVSSLRHPQAIHAAIDVSDGILADLNHILQASHVGAEIDLSTIPLSAAGQGFINKYKLSLEEVVTAGDDYEILFTVPEQKADLVLGIAPQLGVSVSRIGRIVERAGLNLFDASGKKLQWANTGYQHKFLS